MTFNTVCYTWQFVVTEAVRREYKCSYLPKDPSNLEKNVFCQAIEGELTMVDCNQVGQMTT